MPDELGGVICVARPCGFDAILKQLDESHRDGLAVELVDLEHEGDAHLGVGAAAQSRQGIVGRTFSERLKQGLVRVGYDTVRLVDIVMCRLYRMFGLNVNAIGHVGRCQRGRYATGTGLKTTWPAGERVGWQV